MDAMVRKCAGLDVHQETIVACVLKGELDKRFTMDCRIIKMWINRGKFCT